MPGKIKKLSGWGGENCLENKDTGRSIHRALITGERGLNTPANVN